jgi:DNA polymerase-3 subunit beta
MAQTGSQTMTASVAPTSAHAGDPTTNETAEFVVSRADLLEEIAQLQGAVDRKSTIPILNNILIQVTPQALQLTATDLDLSLRTSCPVKMVKPGAFTIPARKLYDYLRLLPSGDITVKVLANDWVQLRSGRSHTKMVGLPRTNFPSLPLFPRDAVINIEAEVLHHLISQTAFAISKDESRYTLNGALLVLTPQCTRMVATDGHRLALVEHTKPNSAITQEVRVLIPQKALLEVSSLLAASGEHIHFAESDSTLFFVIGKRLLTSRRLLGTFPNYEAVLPRDNNNVVVVERDELHSSVMRVSQFADERSNAIRLRLGKNELKLTSSTVETGESEDILQTSFNGDPATIGINSHYLLDFLKVVDAERVRLEFKGPQAAIEFKPEDGTTSDYRYRYVVMPVRG